MSQNQHLAINQTQRKSTLQWPIWPIHKRTQIQTSIQQHSKAQIKPEIWIYKNHSNPYYFLAPKIIGYIKIKWKPLNLNTLAFMDEMLLQIT
jgi:hypothetical protein